MSLLDWDKFQIQVADILMHSHFYKKQVAIETAGDFYKYYMDAYDAEEAVGEYMKRILD